MINCPSCKGNLTLEHRVLTCDNCNGYVYYNENGEQKFEAAQDGQSGHGLYKEWGKAWPYV